MINLLKLNQRFADIENLHLFMIVQQHEFRILYQDDKGARKFLHLIEVEKYLNGMLRII